MTMTWTLVSAIAACALLLIAMVFRPFRFIGRQAAPGTTASRPWIPLLDASAPIIAALIVVGGGALVAQQFIQNAEDRARRERQQVTAEQRARERSEQVRRRLDAVDRLLPQFSRTEQEKTAAILAIGAAGDLNFAAALAGLFPSGGSVTALETIARHSSPDERLPAITALGAMNTDQSMAALARIFDEVTRALVAVDCEAPDGAGTRTVVAGVSWNDRWLLAPLSNLTNARPRGISRAEARGRQTYGDGLTRIRVERQEPASFANLQFSTVFPEQGDPVLAVGLDKSGQPGDVYMGSVASVPRDGVLVRFPRDLRQAPGSLLVLPSGLVVGMLSHDQRQRGVYRYIRADEILGWFEKLEHE